MSLIKGTSQFSRRGLVVDSREIKFENVAMVSKPNHELISCGNLDEPRETGDIPVTKREMG